MEITFNYNGTSLSMQCNKYDIIGQIFEKFALKIGANINSLTFIYGGNGNINRNLQIAQVINYFDNNRSKMSILVYNMNKSMISTYSNSSRNITQFSYPNQNFNNNNNNNINNNFRNLEMIQSQINQLKFELNEEKKKNKLLIDENNKLKNEIMLVKQKYNMLKNQIQIENRSYNNNKYIKEGITSIKPGEKIIAVNFMSMGNPDIYHYSLPCKNTDLFVRLEEKLYDDFPQYKNHEIYFEVKTRRIKRFKTIEENKIKNNDVINVFIADEEYN